MTTENITTRCRVKAGSPTPRTIPPETIPFETLISGDGMSPVDRVLDLMVWLSNCACEPEKFCPLPEDKKWLLLTHDHLASLHYESDFVSSDGRAITIDELAKVAKQRTEARRELAF